MIKLVHTNCIEFNHFLDFNIESINPVIEIMNYNYVFKCFVSFYQMLFLIDVVKTFHYRWANQIGTAESWYFNIKFNINMKDTEKKEEKYLQK
jgi:hypothetical protein